MSNQFPVHDANTAPEASKAALEATAKKYGFVPNLYGVFAASPAAIETYGAIAEQFGKSGLNPVEQQVVLLTISYENNCHYCMAAHSVVAKMSGAEADVIEALRTGAPLTDAKLEALRTFARAVVDKRGEVAEDLPAFLAAGYTPSHALDVLVGNALKTLSNYTNHLAETPVDPQFAEMAWDPASKR